MFGVTALLFFAMVTDGYHVRDQATRPWDEMLSVPNGLGAPGALLAGTLAVLVGDARHILYALTFIWALMLISHKPFGRVMPRLLGAGLVIATMAGFLQLNLRMGTSNPEPGGAVGSFVVQLLASRNFGFFGASVVVLSLTLAGLLMASEHLFYYLFILSRHAGSQAAQTARSFLSAPRPRKGERAARRGVEATPFPEAESAHADDALEAPFMPAGDEAETRRDGAADRGARIHIRGSHANDARPGDDVPPADEPFPFDAVPETEEDEPAGEETSLAIDLDPPEADAPWDHAETASREADTIESDSPEWEADEYAGAESENEAYGEAPEPMDREDADEPEERASRSAPNLHLPADVAAAAGLSSGSASAIPRKDSTPKVRRPRRKIIEHEELPPDYEYPRYYTRPPLDLFDEPEEPVLTNLTEQLRETSILLEDTLLTFGIEARVTDVTRGPTITRYELEPAPGIKVARFLALADDIALALKAHRIRVEAPIPGKGRVGIEAPNVERDQVLVRELLEAPQFQRGKGKLNLVLGKDIAGDVKIADLATMPHLLVAGATGAGKTVCVKALLASLLYKHTPDDLQLILIDPKMVELSIFNDIPHLITPVVIDPKKASIALTWLINEMEERYRLFADLRVRNIEIYNQSVENGEIELEGEDDDHDSHSLHIIRRLPYIVCVIDELADLMMLARSEVEDSIGRLAQLARAVGIHLIIATQRPSVDVLTGVIKANFPSRISFQVSSRVDSRCILDEIGAERLIGMGDMLYLPAGQSKPTRIQGAFVSDEEMNALIMHLKRQAPPQYKDEIENFGKSKDKLDEIADESDELFDEAVQVVMETGQASISMVQRRLRVGYTRAARLIDMMERKGIVGPHTGSKAREILVDAIQVEDR